ncbi:hypothetical protein DPMN_051328 [Dreissena polymorpha]|uniref:Uncharacterized protein n=1 Tax=Dreissena polymorpha TaxID=45954 RepID=A0A9D4HN73_DREPO|nr:hypothetical protein DPMN_051328 [Dreissena polymorpha]
MSFLVTPSPRQGPSPGKGNSPTQDVTPRGRLKMFSKNSEPDFRRVSVKEKKRSARRKSLSKNRIYLKTPENYYKYDPDDPRDVTSSYQRQGTFMRVLNRPSGLIPGRKIVYEKVFPQGNRNRVRKAMIIGERPSLWRLPDIRQPELPGNLFVDNLRHKSLDYRKFNTVTWNDILESHLKDVNQGRDFVQTLPQKEQWLASIDARVKYSKMNHHRGLPYVSPRLFSENVSPTKHPVATKYISKDKLGNVFYIVGPSDVNKKEYRKLVLPEIVKRPQTPKKLNF